MKRYRNFWIPTLISVISLCSFMTVFSWSAAAQMSTPAAEEKNGLKFYGLIDVSFTTMPFGAPPNGSFSTDYEPIISKNTNSSFTGLTSNSGGASKLGLDGRYAVRIFTARLLWRSCGRWSD